MRPEIQDYLDQNPDEKTYVRLHPQWYRKLSRAPWTVSQIRPEANLFYGRTFGQRLDRLNQRARMVAMLMAMAQAMSKRKPAEQSE